MFEQAFKNIDNTLRKEAGCATELDYIEQTSWILFLKYLDDLERSKKQSAELAGKEYTPILADEYRWSNWAAPKTGDGKLDHHKAMTGDDLIDFVDQKLFTYLKEFKRDAERADTIEYKIGEIFSELKNRIQSGYNLREIIDHSTRIPVPPIEEQRRIAAILDEAFACIDKAKANTEKNIQNACELFDSYLNNIFSNPGPDWEEKTLDEVSINFGRGKSRHRPRNAGHLYGGRYPFVQTGDIRNADHIITEYSQTYSEDGLAQSKLWPKGTVCITIAANIAETAILGFDACFPDSVIGVQPNPEKADVDYIEYLLQAFKVSIQAKGKGSAQANINMGTFENERFPFPKVTEQHRIVDGLNRLNEEAQRLQSVNQHRIVELDELKKSLLQKAFSGEL